MQEILEIPIELQMIAHSKNATRSRLSRTTSSPPRRRKRQHALSLSSPVATAFLSLAPREINTACGVAFHSAPSRPPAETPCDLVAERASRGVPRRLSRPAVKRGRTSVRASESEILAREPGSPVARAPRRIDLTSKTAACEIARPRDGVAISDDFVAWVDRAIARIHARARDSGTDFRVDVRSR